MKNILNLNGLDAQHAIVILFATLAVAVFGVFLFITNISLNRIDAAMSEANGILADWQTAKSKLVVQELEPGLESASDIERILAVCDGKIRSASAIPLLDAMRKLDDRPTIERNLEENWRELRRAWSPADSGQARTGGGRPPLERKLALARSFETSLRERTALMARFGRKQRSSLLFLQVSSVFSIMGLTAAGLWTAQTARRSRQDQDRLRELLRATYAGQERERSRIALDLHDSVAQDLASSLMMARRLEETPAGDQARLVASLKSNLDSLRRLSWEIRPPELERLGLWGAVMRLATDFEVKTGYPVKLEVAALDLDRLGGLDLDTELHLYRILQEVLSNVSKHARARSVTVSLAHRPGQLLLSIADDGKGFDAEADGHSGSGPDHMGLAGMRERARLIGGKLRMASRPDEGTTIEVEVPYV